MEHSFHYMEGCQHSGVVCSGNCECQCDPCQTAQEAMWDRMVSTEGLCPKCGIPKGGELTLDRLSQTQVYHFFQPCPDCNASQLEFMKKEKRCIRCQDGLDSEGICCNCKCKQDMRCTCTSCTLPTESKREN